ncbi:MAG: ribosome maturation factor RimM [Burkholderiales bacterium]|nr:ribosome maturation factor RimM [Burkholderiales bacterium]
MANSRLPEPKNLVVMGRVAAPFGVKGWIKVQPYTAAPQNLLAYHTWWLGRDGDWQAHTIDKAQSSGRAVVAKLDVCEDREAALQLRGKQVAVPREALPQAGENEFYWADLIGLRVVNEEVRDLGEVTQILETGANQVLVVQGEGGRERLIPFIADVIGKVDLAAGVIRVDWGEDY